MLRRMDQVAIDEAIEHYYTEQFDESVRLTSRSAQGALEFIRIQEIIAKRLLPGSRILDIGGATGVHAAALADAGHRVTLIDPVEAQVLQAQRCGTFAAAVGDARKLDFEADTFDAALLFGPIYHLQSPQARLDCLREAARVVVAGGSVFVAAIPRLSRHAVVVSNEDVPYPYPPEWISLLESGAPTPGSRFPAGHFHTAVELERELLASGLVDVELCAIEGVVGLALEHLAPDPELLAAALTIARKAAHLPQLLDLTNHVMAIGRVGVVADDQV